MKKLTAICISLILVLASAVLSFGDGLYEVDAQSGQIVNGGYDSETDPVDFVRLSPTCAYDKATRMYVYTNMGSSGSWFNSSVCNGMYTRDAVVLESDPTAMLQVYRNGELLEYGGSGEFYESGAYIVRDKGNSIVLSFSILSDVTGAVNSYDIPTMFFMEELLFNGEAQPLSGNTVSLMEDGDYLISYFCYDTETHYKLNVTIDHTAPVLEIYGVGEDSYAHNAVTIGEMERYSTLAATLDGNEIEPAAELTEAGIYHLVYTDEAGNSSTYDFTITPYLNLNAWLAVVIIAVILLGTGAYMIYTRTHMRVR